MNKLNKILELIKELKSEEETKLQKLKENMLDKLENINDDWFLIMKEWSNLPYKIYSTKAKNYNEAFYLFDELIDNITDGYYILVNKNELSQILQNINNDNITRLKNEN